MLDFYLIRDDQPKPGYPEQAGLEIVGEIDERTFKILMDKKVIPENLDYHTDFRWDTTLTKQIRQHIRERGLTAEIYVKDLVRLLDIADQHDSGLIAYCD